MHKSQLSVCIALVSMHSTQLYLCIAVSCEYAYHAEQSSVHQSNQLCDCTAYIIHLHSNQLPVFIAGELSNCIEASFLYVCNCLTVQQSAAIKYYVQ